MEAHVKVPGGGSRSDGGLMLKPGGKGSILRRWSAAAGRRRLWPKDSPHRAVPAGSDGSKRRAADDPLALLEGAPGRLNAWRW